MIVELTHLDHLIEIEANERTYGGTTFGQRARFKRLEHEQFPDGRISLAIVCVVTLHAADGEPENSPPLSGGGLSSYEVTLRGDYDTLLDQAGNFVWNRYQPDAAAALEEVEASEQVYMWQADAFLLMRSASPVVLTDMIRQHMQAAVAMNRYQ